ncbi:MAG TPA: hypothetical protein VFB79_13295 [Candidatus Angelobacter sp.]|nr:hypothetical protein [Candidatus Angelobacter sp.]
MTNLKFYSSTTVDSSSSKSTRLIGTAATAAATAVLALTFMLDLTGCSKEKNKNASVNSSSQNSTAQAAPSPTPVPTVTPLESKVDAVIEKKKLVKRASTVAYKNNAYGVSFRYPRTYTMLSPEKDVPDPAWPNPMASNFIQPGGETLTTLVLPGTRATSFFKASVNKGVNADECGKFASTPEQTEADTNPPVDANDDSIMPEKSNVLGVDYSKAENVTDLAEVRYYHHFENGACYEFALGVEDAPNTVKPVDHLQVFDKLERIMTTVKIKTEPAQAVAASTIIEPATNESLNQPINPQK